MAGGLIEGIKKCYTGKNLLSKHSFLFILALLMAFPAAISSINANGNDTEAMKYMYVTNPVLGLLSLVCSFTLGIYIVHFIHNSLKFFLWKDTQQDQERIKALQIMPEINGQIFKHFGSFLGFGFIWFVVSLLIFLILFILGIIPGVNFIGIPLFILVMITFCFSMPYIFCGFARNYQIKGNISPFLIFSYIPKIFLPALILILKYIGMIIVYAICVAIFMFVIFLVLGILSGLAGLNPADLAKNVPIMTITTAIITYTSIILGLAYYYATANIYYENIEMNKEI